MLPPSLAIQGHEGKPLLLPAGVEAAEVASEVLRATERCPVPVISLTKAGARLGNVVGVVQAGRVQLEILPKVAAGSSTEQDRSFLLDLLSTAGLSPRLFSTKGGIRTDSPVLLDSVIDQIARRIAKLLISGPPRRYSELRESSPTIRGRIDMKQLAERMPASDHVLPIVHFPLQRDNSLSRLVRALLSTLHVTTRSIRTRRLLARSEEMFGNVKRVPLTRSLVDRVNLSRYEGEWEDVVDFAALLVQGGIPNVVGSGGFSFFGFVFPLPDLFESVVRRVLPEALASTEWRLAQSAESLRLLRSMVQGYETLALRPDYLFVRRGSEQERVLVGDAKWKHLLQSKKGFGAQPSDIYQCATYMTRHNLDRGALFFPETNWMQAEAEMWHHRFSLVGGDSVLTMIGVDFPGLVSRNKKRRENALTKIRQGVEAAVERSGDGSAQEPAGDFRFNFR